MTGAIDHDSGRDHEGTPDLADATLLVAGGERVDAGKTTFSVGLLAALSDREYDPVGVKPRAGNDYWFDHDDYRLAADAGRLYGKDARRLAAAGEGSLAPNGVDRDGEVTTPEVINPLHRLWRPTPDRTGMLGEAGRTFLVDRLAIPGGSSSFVVNGRAEADGVVPDDLFDRLSLADAMRVNDVSEFNDLMADRYVPALARLADRVTGTGPVVLESYGDIAVPLDVPIDTVAVVAPGRVRIYAADRYRKAREVASGSAREGSLEEHTDAVTEMIDPLETVPLPALQGDVRSDPDRIADAYREAYDALVAAI